MTTTLIRTNNLRIIWWPGLNRRHFDFIDVDDKIAPAITISTRSGELLVRFGRDGTELFSERFAGAHGIPKFWYGPGGLSIRWRRYGDREVAR